MKPKIIAVIPARGCNDEIEHLNIKELGGKPMLAYTIETALESAHIQRIVVSTEDERVAEVATKYGAEIPFLRPVELIGEQVSLAEVVKHALMKLEKKDYGFDIVVTLLPNSPFRTSKDVDSAINMLIEQGYASVMSMVEEKDFFWIKDGAKMIPLTHKNAVRRNDCIPIYREAGGIYAALRENFSISNQFNDKMGYYVMSEHNGRAINSLYDLFTSERLIKLPSELIHGLLNSE